MVQLVDGDIRTREVFFWKGVHVLHSMSSSCSQKLRIFLNLKAINWESHVVDLFANENFQPWFLGINPRGLVPVLVHDGDVHIESNDIIQYSNKNSPPQSSFRPTMRMRSPRLEATRRSQMEAGKTLEAVAGF